MQVQVSGPHAALCHDRFELSVYSNHRKSCDGSSSGGGWQEGACGVSKCIITQSVLLPVDAEVAAAEQQQCCTHTVKYYTRIQGVVDIANLYNSHINYNYNIYTVYTLNKISMFLTNEVN